MHEIRVLLRIGIPSMARFYLLCAADRATLAFVGHLDPDPNHVAGAVLGKVYSNVTGLSVGLGIALGINTFVSQNHGRSSDEENGHVFRQCCKALSIAYVFSLATACLSKPILEVAGQPPGVLSPCQQFSVVQALGLPGAWLSATLSNILVSQRIVLPGLIIDGTSAIMNLVLAYVFLRCGVGFLGVALAKAITDWIGLALAVLYVMLWRRQSTIWRLPPTPSKISMPVYLGSSLPSAVSMWAEWWAVEIMALLAGRLGECAVAAHGILINTLAIFYMTFIGLQTATNTRIGNLVGSKDTALLRPSILAATILSLTLSLFTSAFLQVCGPWILHLYTTDANILAEAQQANLGMVLSVPPYSLMIVSVGILRGADLQSWGAIAITVSFFIVGLPTGAILGLGCGFGLLGVWSSNIIGLSLSAIAIWVRIAMVDWARVVDKAAREIDLNFQGESPSVPMQTRFLDSSI